MVCQFPWGLTRSVSLSSLFLHPHGAGPMGPERPHVTELSHGSQSHQRPAGPSYPQLPPALRVQKRTQLRAGPVQRLCSGPVVRAWASLGVMIVPGAVASSSTLDAPESKGISVQLEVGEDYTTASGWPGAQDRSSECLVRLGAHCSIPIPCYPNLPHSMLPYHSDKP